MKKYTIIYSVSVGRASMVCYMTKFDRVETDDLAKLIQDDKYEGNVTHIFEGHPKLEGE